ncbi:melanocortin receptor 4-like [Rhinatrema bivittatum]|uniref:melanocortin receptor 4-like n=1 Tax=Rhinatrema bivittatum TaxID=194408 RepID=UPI00112C1604|nr:melanocortin receptor 4-like [Rhinatrema bivittatum]
MIPLAVTPDSVSNLLLLLFHACLATAIAAINLSVLIPIISSRSLRRENRFIYMMSTCISDFCTGVSWFYVGLFDVKDDYPGKNSTKFIASNFLGLSYLSILAAQADRYHAVVSPIRYSQRMSPAKTVLVIGCLWTYSYIILIVQNLTSTVTAKQISSIGLFVVNIFTMGIMIGLNVKLYLIAKYQLARDPATPERESKRASLHLIIGVAASFILLWAPVFIFILFCNFSFSQCPQFSNEGTDPFAVLAHFNAVLTPLLYLRSCAQLRETLCGKVWKCCHPAPG